MPREWRSECVVEFPVTQYSCNATVMESMASGVSSLNPNNKSVDRRIDKVVAQDPEPALFHVVSGNLQDARILDSHYYYG